jgi:hypothetical protein
MLAPFPNPFRGSVRATLQLARAMDVSADVFDVWGRRVRRLAHARFEAGLHDIAWDGFLPSGDSAPVGLYFLRARMGATTQEWRLVRVR